MAPTAGLTPRERVRRALGRQVSDRVPINYFANAGIDRRLKAHFGLAADDSEGLLRALGVDFRRVEAAYAGPALHPAQPERQIDGWGIRKRWIGHDTGGYWDYCDFPLREADDEAVERWPMPSPDAYDYSGAAAAAAACAEFAVVLGGTGLGDILNKAGMIFGVEETLVRLIGDAPALLHWTDRRLAVQVAVIERTLAALRGRADLLWMGEDLGTQIAPILSLELFRRHLRPRLQRIVDVGRRAGVPVMIHSCGASSWAFDEFVDMGIAVVDTLQPEAAGMAPARLKQSFGDRLAFHGCISTAALARETPEGVEAMVRDTLGVMMPGGGYALAPTHLLQDNTPTENAVAMYAAAARHGAYQ